MSVHFFVPDQRDAWERINKPLFAKRAGWSDEVLEQWWKTAKLGIHEMASDDGSFGYLVLATVDLGLGKWLQVLWCEVRPCKALRSEKDWLWDAARYLERLARAHDCTHVKISVNEDHPSRHWQRRLRGVGFVPRVTELWLPAKKKETTWPVSPSQAQSSAA